MSSPIKQPIRSLPSRDNSGVIRDVLVEVVEMRWEHVNLWHTFVQPIVDARFVHAAPRVPPQNVRADVGWDWGKNFALVLLHNALRAVPGNASGRAIGLALVVHTLEGDSFPVGLLTAVPRFMSEVNAVKGQRAFAWYLADAPRALYSEFFNVPPIRGVAVALLDCAIQSGLDIDLDSEFLLHADPNGGGKLRKFYEDDCGMTAVKGESKISFLRRRHSGEYFYMDNPTAQSFCAQNDYRRIG